MNRLWSCFLEPNRILAFSEAPITAVHVSVDGRSLGEARPAGGPLFVLSWDPSLYATGLHSIWVKVQVNDSRIPVFCCICVCQEVFREGVAG